MLHGLVVIAIFAVCAVTLATSNLAQKWNSKDSDLVVSREISQTKTCDHHSERQLAFRYGDLTSPKLSFIF
jgi:hypothetical protein